MVTRDRPSVRPFAPIGLFWDVGHVRVNRRELLQGGGDDRQSRRGLRLGGYRVDRAHDIRGGRQRSGRLGEHVDARGAGVDGSTGEGGPDPALVIAERARRGLSLLDGVTSVTGPVDSAGAPNGIISAGHPAGRAFELRWDVA